MPWTRPPPPPLPYAAGTCPPAAAPEARPPQRPRRWNRHCQAVDPAPAPAGESQHSRGQERPSDPNLSMEAVRLIIVEAAEAATRSHGVLEPLGCCGGKWTRRARQRRNRSPSRARSTDRAGGGRGGAAQPATAVRARSVHAAWREQLPSSPDQCAFEAPCRNSCGRPAAQGYEACCRTCSWTEGASHGPRCEAAFRQGGPTDVDGVPPPPKATMWCPFAAPSSDIDDGNPQPPHADDESLPPQPPPQVPVFDKEVANGRPSDWKARAETFNWSRKTARRCPDFSQPHFPARTAGTSGPGASGPAWGAAAAPTESSPFFRRCCGARLVGRLGLEQDRGGCCVGAEEAWTRCEWK